MPGRTKATAMIKPPASWKSRCMGVFSVPGANMNIKVPMKMEFKGADICLILGNLLENAVEAAEKAKKKKYIKIQMKYDRGNLLIFLMNSYQGRLIKMKDKRLKSTKSDAGNHGVGLPSVYRAVAKYNGTVDRKSTRLNSSH